MKTLRLHDASKGKEQFDIIASAYINAKGRMAALDEEIEGLKVELDKLLGDDKTYETENFTVSKAEQSRRNFNLSEALNNISEKILAPFISISNYQTYRVREKSVSTMKKAA